MTVAIDAPFRSWSSHVIAAPTLEDKYEILNDIGDGSFGSVVLGRTRSGGAHIARKGTLVSTTRVQRGASPDSTFAAGHQDHEEDFRVHGSVQRAARSHLLKHAARPSASRADV